MTSQVERSTEDRINELLDFMLDLDKSIKSCGITDLEGMKKLYQRNDRFKLFIDTIIRKQISVCEHDFEHIDCEGFGTVFVCKRCGERDYD